LYQACEAPTPTFYHLPLICNAEGKKLSKRDFGFSLGDLRTGGFLPEAICNYLGIIGGSFAQEILTFEELTKAVNFDHLSQASQIRYDVEKLRWVNHKWINSSAPAALAQLVTPLLQKAYPVVQHMPQERIETLLKHIQADMVTLHDAVTLLRFIFERSTVDQTQLEAEDGTSTKELFGELLSGSYATSTALVEKLKQLTKVHQLQMKQVMSLTRLALTGSVKGMGVAEIIELLGVEETMKRLEILGRK
jgi:glutamyl/glutaminyl-tRNA synthetase